MSDLIRSLLLGLKGILNEQTFRALSIHVLSSIEQTTRELWQRTVHENADITLEQVMDTLTNTTLIQFTRSHSNANPHNVNQQLIAAYSIVITHFYGDDTIVGYSGNQLFRGYLGLERNPFKAIVANFCSTSQFDVQLARDGGEFRCFYEVQVAENRPIDANAAINDFDIAYLETCYRLTRAILDSQGQAGPDYYPLVNLELGAIIVNTFSPEEFVTTFQNLSGDGLFYKLLETLASLQDTQGLSPALYGILRYTFEKLAVDHANLISKTPHERMDEANSTLLQPIVAKILNEHASSTLYFAIKPNRPHVAAMMRAALLDSPDFYYLVALKRLRARLYTDIATLYFQNNENHRRSLIKRVSCQALSTLFSQQELWAQMQRYGMQTNGPRVIEQVITFIDRHYKTLPLYAHFLGICAFIQIWEELPQVLPCSDWVADTLTEHFNARFIAEWGRPQAQQPLHLRIEALLNLRGITPQELPEVIKTAFMNAAEHHPMIGFEMLSFATITSMYQAPPEPRTAKMHTIWSRTQHRVNRTIMRKWIDSNQATLEQDWSQLCFELFIDHLKMPVTEESKLLKNPNNYSTKKLQQRVSSVWDTQLTIENEAAERAKARAVELFTIKAEMSAAAKAYAAAATQTTAPTVARP